MRPRIYVSGRILRDLVLLALGVALWFLKGWIIFAVAPNDSYMLEGISMWLLTSGIAIVLGVLGVILLAHALTD